MENTSQQQPNLDQAEIERAALIDNHKVFLERAALQGRTPDSLLTLLKLADLANSILGKILKDKRIC